MKNHWMIAYKIVNFIPDVRHHRTT